MIRVCPSCSTPRPITEILCAFEDDNGPCQWNLLDVPIVEVPTTEESSPQEETSQNSSVTPSTPTSPQVCLNGHPLDEGDFLCLECGEPAQETAPQIHAEDAAEIETLQGWEKLESLPSSDPQVELWLASNDPQVANLRLYPLEFRQEGKILAALRSLPPAQFAKLLESGEHEGRAYDCWEAFPLGTLREHPRSRDSKETLAREILEQTGAALHALGQRQLVHQRLCPETLANRSLEPNTWVVSDLDEVASVELELDSSTRRQPSRYSSPEVIAGTVSATSDFWSLGVILLEILSEHELFAGLQEKAILLHVVTRGWEVPSHLPTDWQELLKGLLTPDPSLRWSWDQIQAWLAGETGIPHGYRQDSTSENQLGNGLSLGDKTYATAERFALAAVDQVHWEEALNLAQSGRLSTWLLERGNESDITKAAQIRDIMAEVGLDQPLKLALSAMVLNPLLPLCIQGDIVSPQWLLAHAETAWAWLDSALIPRLKQWDREPWLVHLKERAENVRQRVKEYRIDCDAVQLEAAMLSVSRSKLEQRWWQKRQQYPEADQPHLRALSQLRSPSEEDLILLISATPSQFRHSTEVLDEAQKEADAAGIAFSYEHATRFFEKSRSDLFKEIDSRLANFSRCGVERVDQWADDFRMDRRMTLARALVLLSVPKDQWKEPERQEYVRNILDFFHRRLVSGLQRGGLIRMTIGKTTSRLDLTELHGQSRSATDLLNVILRRQTQPLALDPQVLLSEPRKENRLRRLFQNSVAYRRDTGINPLYLGFPFIVLRDARALDQAKPRIAPVLLWPVALEMPTGQRGTVKLSFHEEREVKLNPALENLLGSKFSEWREMLQELLSRDALDLQSIQDAFSHVSTITATSGAQVSLQALPPASVTVSEGQIHLYNSAVLFQCDFSGQTIAQDILQLSKGIPLAGTALESAIRLTDIPSPPPIEAPRELDRYFTAASDPSQQTAVFRSRQAPGLVVQGPPGTGKSQTIVNIVSDAMGRGERVLIVCQKQAALDVVRKRLDTEGMGSRLFYLKDTTSDRRPALQQLREQLEDPTHPEHEFATLNHQRASFARHIEELEKELNSVHHELHESPAPEFGKWSYRKIMDELLALENAEGAVFESLPHVGNSVASLDPQACWKLFEEIASVAPLWLKSGYETSYLHAFQAFSTTPATLESLNLALENYRATEVQRSEHLATYGPGYITQSITDLDRWLLANESFCHRLSEVELPQMQKHHPLLVSGDPNTPSQSQQLLQWLKSFESEMSQSRSLGLDARLTEKLSTRGQTQLQEFLLWLKPLGGTKSLFTLLNPFYHLAKYQVNAWIRETGVDPDTVEYANLIHATTLEAKLRAIRPDLQRWAEVFEVNRPEETPSVQTMCQQSARLLQLLPRLIEIAQTLSTCPSTEIQHHLFLAGSRARLLEVLERCERTVARSHKDEACKAALQDLSLWATPEWQSQRALEIDQAVDAKAHVTGLIQDVPHLPEFQQFRARLPGLDPLARSLFGQLRSKDAFWKGLPSNQLAQAIETSLKRESLILWKHEAEWRQPALTMDHGEFDRKVLTLKQQDDAIRDANRKLLHRCASTQRLAARAQWDDVTMYQGPRARRLREVVERGEALGLFNLRPIWMMNPEMVSRLFPLRAGLFDVVIFDEASQLPVESAIPAMFRAKRIVVSGDDKQMPPSRFFGSKLESDEDEDSGADGDDQIEENEELRERQAQAAGRREVKDCSDLLTLSQNLLPTATLQIHYRSQYRELIEFSNAAYYGGRLSVPAKHPSSEVLQAKPVELDRVDGLYSDQTNLTEAKRVVQRLRELWKLPASQRPSVGVVTFNLKQAELIDEEIEALAEEDSSFCDAWNEELERSQNGEDMGFFVKNLENVQGDERDWIIFSTTFGRNEDGRFFRKFGVLGQQGGERRLNVAVTRARLKVVVVTSMPVNEISDWLKHHQKKTPLIPRDYIQAWLAHAEAVSSGNFEQAQHYIRAILGQSASRQQTQQLQQESHSRLVYEVGEFIRSLGHEPVPSQGDAFGLDFAIADPTSGHFQLGVECDSHQHPVLSTARAREIWRPSILSNSVGHVHRVSSRSWYHEREAEQNRLRAAIARHLSPPSHKP